MSRFNIGLDFGTSQSKACIYDSENDTHEFFLFPSNNKFFLPSRVAKLSNGRFEYGNTQSSSEIEKEYLYFKIAAAEDDEFYFETFGQNRQSTSKSYFNGEFAEYTPEFLSVIYLTYLLFTIKEKYQKPDRQTVNVGFLAKLFAKKNLDAIIDFTVQIGIPTEWSQQKNLKRKRKFENILMLSELMQTRYKTLQTFLNIQAIELIQEVNTISNTVNFSTLQEYDGYLNELGISVYPETAAGLSFILNTRQVKPGYYAIMDIGAGSTDISFFRVQEGFTIKYLASESYLTAANTVYGQYTENINTINAVHNVEQHVKKIVENDSWKGDPHLVAALEKVDKILDGLLYKLFNKRVYFFDRVRMVTNYSDQPIILYGGGAKLPKLGTGVVKIHDQGTDSFLATRTFLNKLSINSYTHVVNILPSNGAWKSDFSMLVVALGLSYIKPPGTASWFNNEDYRPRDGESSTEVPHPFNEGLFIYDVLRSKWS